MDTTTALHLLLLSVGAIAVAAFARRYGLPAPVVLVLAGLGVSFVPGMPEYALDPGWVLLVFLPPLLYSASLDSSYLSLRENIRAIGLLSVGLVLFTTVVVGLVAHAIVPGLPLGAAFALGAIVAPPDAVAAVAVSRRLGLPRRMITILVGESLVNDATALTAYRVAIAAAVGEGISLLGAAGQFLLAAGGGLAIGLILAPLLHQLMRRLHDPLVENTVSLIIPFAVYLAAEAVHASGVLAVVVVGVYLGHRMTSAHFSTRLQSDAVWRFADFFLECLVFALIGLQLRPIMRGLDGWSTGSLIWYTAAVFVTVVLVRIIWVFPATFLPHRMIRRLRQAHGAPSWRIPAAVSWAGMRGVVSLAAAFAIPQITADGRPFPDRALLLYLALCVVLGTLLIQGLTFPAVIKRLGVGGGRESFADNLAEAAAQQAAARAALARLDEIAAEGELGERQPDVLTRLRQGTDQRALGAWERLGGGAGPEGTETPSAVYRRLRREMLAAEREVFVRLRDERRIDDEVLRRVMLELDLEEAALERD